MNFTSEQITTLMNNARGIWSCSIRLKITAGWGCTVLEIFDFDAGEPSVPIHRMLLQSFRPSHLPEAFLST